MGLAPITKGVTVQSNVIRITSSRISFKQDFVQMVLKITFFKIVKKNGRHGIMQQTTIGFSRKHKPTEEREMFEEAFKFAVAQISFSWDRFIVVDKAFLWFRPREFQ